MSIVKNLKKNYSNFNLSISEWEIPDQGVSALCGPSGAGKTTIFRILCGLEECQGFEWHYKGIDLARLPVEAKRLGVVFQGYELFPHMTVEENLLFSLKARGLKTEAKSKIKDWIEKLNLSRVAKTRSDLLSGGEKQRTALARALIAEPQFLLLDEPFSALDIDLRSAARNEVKNVLSELNIPALLITHDKEDIEVLAKYVFEIMNGKLVGIK